MDQELKIRKVNNGYIVVFDTIIGPTTEVYERFEDLIKEVKRWFKEERE